MLYERFWHWLTFHKRRHCKHEEMKKIGNTIIHLGSYEVVNADIYECIECHKKEKRPKWDDGINHIMYY